MDDSALTSWSTHAESIVEHPKYDEISVELASHRGGGGAGFQQGGLGAAPW